MSALRLSTPSGIRFVDLGPASPYRNPFRAVSGHKLEPRSGTNGHNDPGRQAEYQRRHVAKKRAAQCGR